MNYQNQKLHLPIKLIIKQKNLSIMLVDYSFNTLDIHKKEVTLLDGCEFVTSKLEKKNEVKTNTLNQKELEFGSNPK